MTEVLTGRSGASRVRAPRSLRHRDRQLVWGLACAAPALLGFLLWRAVPIGASLVVALTDWNVVRSPHWVGLANFRRMLADPLFWTSLRVTAAYALLSVPASMLASFWLAVLLSRRIPGQRLFRTLFYLPSVMPAVAACVLWLWLFNPDFGLINALLDALDLPRGTWLTSEATVLLSLVLMSLWGIGPMMIIFLAAVQGVPRTLYDAVRLDGGKAWHRLWHVTLPMITPAILFNLVISLIAALQTFTQAYVMTDGGPNNASLFLAFYIYRTGFKNSDMGYASALSWGLFGVIAVFSAIILSTARWWVYYEGER